MLTANGLQEAAVLPDGRYKLGVNDVDVVDGDAMLAGARRAFPAVHFLVLAPAVFNAAKNLAA